MGALCGYGQNKKELILIQQQKIDSLIEVVDTSKSQMRIHRTEISELEATLDRSKQEAANKQRSMDDLQSRSDQFEQKVSQLTQRVSMLDRSPAALDVSNTKACLEYLKGKSFTGETWGEKLSLKFEGKDSVQAFSMKCGEWWKEIPKYSGTWKLDPVVDTGRNVRRIQFGPDLWALLCSDGFLIWPYEGSNLFMPPESDLLSRPGQTVEIEGVYLDAGGNMDVGQKLIFMIHSNEQYVRYVFEDGTFGTLNPHATQPLYLDMGAGMDSYSPNLSLIGKRFILTVARGESNTDESDPQSYPADHLVGIRAIDQ
ncbi:MAG: hypothetical protein IPL86_09745 [Flavobacteriales bacterium]|nr:hypothetical protein [Flavobacteriales bacterium]